MNGIINIDHPVIASANLDQARADFERLGFTVPPRGSHIQWGTGNLCIMFPEDYLEVRGIIDASKFTMHLDSHLDNHGEGLMGVAFGTEDVAASYASAQAAGIQTGELRELTRNFEHPEGWTQPKFQLFAPDADDIEGLMHVVVIEHLTPELLRRPEFLQHENTCLGVLSVEGTVDSVDRTASKLGRLLGDAAVSKTDNTLSIKVGTDQSLHLSQATDATPCLTALTLAVQSVDAVRAVLEKNAVPYEVLPDGSVAANAANTALRFQERTAG